MKKINCTWCFRNFMQLDTKFNEVTCPYCKQCVLPDGFVKCKPIEDVEPIIITEDYEEVGKLFDSDDLVASGEEIEPVESDSVIAEGDEGFIPDDGQSEDESENSHNEDEENMADIIK